MRFLQTLSHALDPTRTSIADGWIGLEPTFQSKKSIKLYDKYEDDDDRFFNHAHMQGTAKSIAKRMAKRWRKAKESGAAWAVFHDVDVKKTRDPWNVARMDCAFQLAKRAKEKFEIKVGIDPSTWELSIKPVPIAWFYDERFVTLLQKLVFDIPERHGLSASLANGGGQFHLSAKTMLTGSLLADDVASRLDHPELSTWIMDWPNCDDRCFRATKARFKAFQRVLHEYWEGAYHPRATGDPTVENAYLDRGFEPARNPPRGLMDAVKGPAGTAREVFQTNFVFGRALRLRAQAVHPGYWQLAHPDDDGYRPDQIMRYSEGNLNRLQIAGELHVKSGHILDGERVQELSAPLSADMLVQEASWEIRAMQSHASAIDMVEAVLLDVHHARYLQKNPKVKVRATLLQDQLLVDAPETVRRKSSAAYDRLRRQARKLNARMSRGRVKSDFIEPETLFWAAWRALSVKAQAEIAREVVAGFVERVHNAASEDPRGLQGDPMDAHRHRINPLIWKVLSTTRARRSDVVGYELSRFESDRDAILAKRPVFSQRGDEPPWPP